MFEATLGETHLGLVEADGLGLLGRRGKGGSRSSKGKNGGNRLHC